MKEKIKQILIDFFADLHSNRSESSLIDYDLWTDKIMEVVGKEKSEFDMWDRKAVRILKEFQYDIYRLCDEIEDTRDRILEKDKEIETLNKLN